MNPKKYDIIIIGAGLAGLACGIRLKKTGKSILIIEKNNTVGGKLQELKWNDYRWDKGPSLLTSPSSIDELFILHNKNPRDYFQYKKEKESCRYFFQDNSSVVFSSKKNQLLNNLTELDKEINLENVNDYIANNHIAFNKVGNYFLTNTKLRARDLLKRELIPKLPFFLKSQIWTSLSKYNKLKLKNEKLELIFNRFGTYNGSNPYRMSGLFSMISDLEITDGSYFPVNGMRGIIKSLYKLALEINIDFKFNTSPKIHKEGANYIVKADDNYVSNKIVCAIDHVKFYNEIAESVFRKKIKYTDISTSGLIFYWAINGTFKEFGTHNILFSDNYKKESNFIDEGKLYSKPTIYIHISSKSVSNQAPKNCENWFIMINIPAGSKPTQEYREEMKKHITNEIKRLTNVSLSNLIEFESYWDDVKIEAETGSFNGALYGEASNELKSIINRHGNQSKTHKDIYFCGGTVHPGGGIPLVLNSAKIVANLIDSKCL